MDITVDLNHEEIQDAIKEAANKAIPLDQCIAGRLQGKARDLSKKKLQIKSFSLGANDFEPTEAVAVFAEQPEAVWPCGDISVGGFKNIMTANAEATPIRIVVDGADLPLGKARFLLDDGVLTLSIKLPDEPQPEPHAQLTREVQPAPPDVNPFAVLEGQEAPREEDNGVDQPSTAQRRRVGRPRKAG